MTLAIALLAASLTALGAAVGVVWHRARAGRRQLAAELHQRGLALDQRADHLAAALDRLELGLRLARLSDQVEVARRRGLLSAGTADRLAGLILAWRAEGLSEPARRPDTPHRELPA